MPFFNLASPDAGGLFVRPSGWSGQWAASFGRVEDGRVLVRAGIEKTHLRLHPGEQIRAPAILLMRYNGDTVAGHNLFRRMMLQFLHPASERQGTRAGGGRLRGAGRFQQCQRDEPDPGRLEHRRAQAAGELLLDQRRWSQGGFAEGMGNWDPEPARFPRGLKPVADKVREAGLKFLVWFEPERVMPGTWLRRNHPEWLLTPANFPGPMAYQRDWRLLNRRIPEALAWIKRTFGGYVRDLGLGVYRLDFNMHPLYYWRAAEAEDRQGITRSATSPACTTTWTRSAATIPACCWMIAPAADSRNDRSDAPHGAAAALRLPVGPGGRAVLHLGALALGAGLRPWRGFARPLRLPQRHADLCHLCLRLLQQGRAVLGTAGPAAQGVSQGPAFLQPELYPLTDYSTRSDRWMAWQFDAPELSQGIIQAFRRASNNVPSLTFKLRGLDPEATYTITDFDAAGARTATGNELMKGLLVKIPTAPGSALLQYLQ